MTVLEIIPRTSSWGKYWCKQFFGMWQILCLQLLFFSMLMWEEVDSDIMESVKKLVDIW